MNNYLYLTLNVLTISVPLMRSFEPKIRFAQKWYALLPAIMLTAGLFVIWDHWFTIEGVWGFNPDYLIGVYIFSLPLEEWLFFITVPFACVFIYEVLNFFIRKDYFASVSLPLTVVLIVGFLIIGLLHLDKWYTSTNFIFAAFVLGIHLAFFGTRIMGRFYLAYLVHLIPFFLVNGVLTGSWIAEPIVWYNNDHNLSIRLGTIPVEDLVYSMSLLLLNISLYEYIKERKSSSIKHQTYVKSSS